MSNPKSSATWFLLGREPLLSAAEILSLLRRERIIFEKIKLEGQFLRLSGNIPAAIIKQLGGTIKIAEELAENLSEVELMNKIQTKLSSATGKIIFGISVYGENQPEKIERWGKELKKNLKAEGRSVRYIFKGESTLSSVTVEKNSLDEKGFEFLIQKTMSGYNLAKTLAVQPFESFSSRDYGRPGRDSESGMLPPKLAMMMINLTEAKLDDKILDPFCGSGTIVSEALLLGYHDVVGTDLSEKAIADSRQNLAWLSENFGVINTSYFFVEQVAVENLSQKFAPESITAIATEPYLGKPKRGNEAVDQLKNEAHELANLYTTAFSEFKKILRPGGRVVFIIPRFIMRSAAPITISDKILPGIQKLGFMVDPLLPEFSAQGGSASGGNKLPYLLYQRPGQFVAREVWRFKLI